MMEGLAGFYGLLLFLVLVPAAILYVLAPFFWYGTWYRAKQLDLKLEETNRLLARIERQGIIASGGDE